MDTDYRMEALADALDIKKQDTDILGNNAFGVGGGIYLVLTDDEADKAFNERIKHHIIECVLNDVPEKYHSYFDYDKSADDIKEESGRGNTLAIFDNVELDGESEGKTFYIYRIN